MKLTLNKSALFIFLLTLLAACQTTQPAAPIPVTEAVRVYAPEPTPVMPAPEPEPVYVEPDQRWLPGHSSYTTPVPVDPVEVDELGPVIPE